MKWPPRDWRALLALLGSIGGAAALTPALFWGIWGLLPGNYAWTQATELHRAETIRWVLWIVAGTIAIVIVGLGMAINRRSIKAKAGSASFDFEGGESELPPMPPKIDMPTVAFATEERE